MKNRGGSRPGAGRPKSEKTKVMRIPISLVPTVEKLIKEKKLSIKMKYPNPLQ